MSLFAHTHPYDRSTRAQNCHYVIIDACKCVETYQIETHTHKIHHKKSDFYIVLAAKHVWTFRCIHANWKQNIKKKNKTKQKPTKSFVYSDIDNAQQHTMQLKMRCHLQVSHYNWFDRYGWCRCHRSKNSFALLWFFIDHHSKGKIELQIVYSNDEKWYRLCVLH